MGSAITRSRNRGILLEAVAPHPINNPGYTPFIQIGGAKLKALSMMQPYAWLFANGLLTIDDRTWPTQYRGPVAIHASQKFHQPYYDFLRKYTRVQLPEPNQFEYGGIVGVAELTGCLPPVAPAGTSLDNPDLRRSHLGAPGHYGLVFENARPVEFVTFRGNRGLFDVPGNLVLTFADC